LAIISTGKYYVQAVTAPRLTSRFGLPDEAATARLGTALGRAIEAGTEAIVQQGLVIGLSGELGAGKTALVRAALRRLGVVGPVRSPTFSLLELYPLSRLNFYHFDFYRFSDAGDFASSGFRDFFGPGSVCAMEWPERAGEASFSLDLLIRMQVADAGRVAHIDALTEAGEHCLQETTRAWQISPEISPESSQDGAC
jgi:tRNA threonylcarbamoyladenosine biosynthesis protein TsaE